MEHIRDYYTMTAENLTYVISSLREQREENLDKKFRTKGLNNLMAHMTSPAQIKNLEFTQTMLAKHAGGMRPLQTQILPAELIEMEFDKTLSLAIHAENMASIVSHLTPRTLKKPKATALPADDITTPLRLTSPGKTSKIIPLQKHEQPAYRHAVLMGGAR